MTRLQSFCALVLLPVSVLSAQQVKPVGPLRSVRETRGDTLVVRTISGSAWGDRVRLVEELRIGTLEGEGPAAFGRAEYGAVFPDGVIAVFDAAIPAIQLFGPDGKFLRTIGREGSGPGEYRNRSYGLFVDRESVLTMFDARNNRLNRWKEDGSILPAWSVQFVPPTAIQAVHFDSLGQTFIKASVFPRLGGPREYGLVRFDRLGNLVDTSFAPAIAGEVAPVGTVAYLSPAKFWIRGRTGSWISAFSGNYALFATEGSRTVRMERVLSRVSVEAGERENYTRLAEFGRQRTDGLAPMWPVPDTKPYFRWVLSDGDGRIWLQLRSKATHVEPRQLTQPVGTPQAPPLEWVERSIWDAFRKDGTYLGQIDLPPLSYIVEARGDKIWAVVIGEDQEQYIVRYRLEGANKVP